MMDTFAINEARKPSRIGSLAIVSSALLCTIGAVSPALSADLPFGDAYQGCYSNCYDDYAGYSRDTGYYDCYYSCAPRWVAPQWGPVSERTPWGGPAVGERYGMERPYPYYLASTRYAYPPPGYSHYTQYPPGAQYSQYPRSPYHYSSYYYPGPRHEADSYAGYRAPYGDPRHPPGQGWNRDAGAQYPPYQASYEYQANPRNRYPDTTRSPNDYRGYRPEYEYRPPYERDIAQRSPTGGPDGYYGPGYPQ